MLPSLCNRRACVAMDRSIRISRPWGFPQIGEFVREIEPFFELRPRILCFDVPDLATLRFGNMPKTAVANRER